jgi:trans-aconitate methyltransferase
MTQNLNTYLAGLFTEKQIYKIVLSLTKIPSSPLRVTIRPLTAKGQIVFQFTEEYANRAVHKNYTPKAASAEIAKWLSETYAEAHFFTPSSDDHWIKGKNGTWKCKSKAATLKPPSLVHNREKNYLIDPSAPFWIKLGVADEKGKIRPSMQAKFRQVSKFLEIADDVIQQLPSKAVLEIVDFGCGKSYLTFALTEYLRQIGKRAHITGIDLKEDVVSELNRLAKSMEFDELSFVAGNIRDHAIDIEPDLVISLHACDIATDYLLAKAIRHQAKAILAVPCCQHEVFKQVEHASLQPLLKHGILKERFSALVTDAVRASMLEQMGYQTQILEFIDSEHTPKNLLIRAIKKASGKSTNHAVDDFCQFLNIHPQIVREFNHDHFTQS